MTGNLGLRVRKLAHIATHPRSRRIFATSRIAPSIEFAGLLRGVTAGTVIDVGANRGQFTLFALESLDPVEVVAFEPLAEEAARYRKTFATESRVKLHQCALGATEARATLNVSASPDSSSLLPISARQERSFPGTGVVGSVQVSVEPLTSFVDETRLIAPTLVKIDVQGTELEVLRGAEPLLPQVRWLLVEASFDELYEGQPSVQVVMDWLREKGFVMRRARSTTDAQAVPVQIDILFELPPPAPWS